MLLVDAESLGRVAFERMIRDGYVVPATRRFAFPVDITVTPSIRAWCVVPMIPAHTVLSGLAGLWVWHGGQWPGEVTVVGKRGLHRSVAEEIPLATSDRTRFHSGLAWHDASVPMGPIAIANPARCCSDALRWDSHKRALVAVANAVKANKVPIRAIDYEVRRDDPRGAGYGRLAEVWQLLYPVLVAIDKDRGATRRGSVRKVPRSA